MRASRFLARRECPVCAPLRRNLVFVRAMRVANTFSRAPVIVDGVDESDD